MRLEKDFYIKSAIEIAPAILGKIICRRTDDGIMRAKITETEIYYGEEDTACHASKGKTNRTKLLYNEGGYAYVYLCYGIHSLFNIVTGTENHPEAVLIRGIKNYNGPGRLTKYLGIDRTFNGENMITSNKLWLEDDGTRWEYITDIRVGIDYATEEYRNKLWRFIATEDTK